ncbi:hypothetical protein NA78x_001901 [Anatilimnocola sp. NA78]|uniref:hypothetical protein n=1 Tax=Anatilimnocola sp. NA78 TaxID=3415683 RepID=UPI003CE4818A
MIPSPIAPIAFISPPRPAFVLAAMSLLMVCLSSLLAGVFLRLAIRTANPLEGLSGVVGSGLCVWLVWLHMLGTFRPSETKAIDAANWDVGIAGLLAMHLAAWVLVATSVLTAAHCLVTIAVIVFLAVQAWLSLRWARLLQRLEWTPPDQLHFSIRELLVLTLACAAAASGYRLMDEQAKLHRTFEDTFEITRLDELPRDIDESHRRSAVPDQSRLGRAPLGTSRGDDSRAYRRA